MRTEAAGWPARILACLLGLILLAGAPRCAAPATGQPAPDFNLPGRTDSLGLAQLKGQVLLLDFWASWCGPCAQSFPWLESLQQKYKDQGFTVLAVNVDKERRKAETFLAGQHVSFPIAFDPKGKTAAAYALPGMPSSFVIDRAGLLRRSHTGFRREEAAEVETFIQGLLAEPAPAETGR